MEAGREREVGRGLGFLRPPGGRGYPRDFAALFGRELFGPRVAAFLGALLARGFLVLRKLHDLVKNGFRDGDFVAVFSRLRFSLRHTRLA